MSKLLIPNMEIFCAAGFIAVFTYIIIAIYFNIADVLFTRRYPCDDYTTKQLNELWKSHHRILPRGGIPLAGLASGVAFFIIGIGFVAQIIYAVVQSLL